MSKLEELQNHPSMPESLLGRERGVIIECLCRQKAGKRLAQIMEQTGIILTIPPMTPAEYFGHMFPALVFNRQGGFFHYRQSTSCNNNLRED